MPSADWQAASAITNKWGLAPAHITASDVSAAYKTGLGWPSLSPPAPPPGARQRRRWHHRAR